MLDTYKRFWSLTFNNEERDNRYQFWVPFFINLLLLILLVYSLRWIERINFNIIFLPILIFSFLLIGYPVMSSAMRRVNDVGKDNSVYKNVTRLYRILLGILCLIIAVKYFLKFELFPTDIGLMSTIFITSFVIIFLCYALLPTNYFDRNNIKNRID